MPKPSVLAIDGVLVVTIQDDPTYSESEDLLSLVGDAVVANAASGVLIDVSILSVVDSYVAQMLGTLISMARLLGSPAIIAGMRPEVALTMVELGLDLPGVVAVMNVNVGLASLRKQMGRRN